MSRTIETFAKTLFFFKMCGLIHFSIVSGHKKLQRFLSTIYFIALASILLWKSYFDYHECFYEDFLFGSNVAMLRLIEICTFLNDEISSWLAVAMSVIYHKQQLQVLLNTDKIDELVELYFMQKSPNHKWNLSAVVPVNFIAFVIGFFLPNFLFLTPPLPRDLSTILDYFVCPLVLQTGMSKYTFFVMILSSRLTTLKGILNDLVNHPGQKRSLMINKILTIKRIYSLIYECSLLINSSMGLPVFFLFGVILTIIIKSVYWLFLEFLSEDIDIGNFTGKHFEFRREFLG